MKDARSDIRLGQIEFPELQPLYASDWEKTDLKQAIRNHNVC